MAFRIASERAGHFKSPVRTIGSTAQTAYPLANITDYLHPYRQYRSTAAASTSIYCGLDFGAAFAVDAVIVGNVNVASIKIQGHTADSWGSPTRDSGALTVAQDAYTGRCNYFYAPSGWTSGTRYIRVVANTSTTTDESGVFAVGYLLVLSGSTTLTIPFADPVDRTPVEPVIVSDLVGGGDGTVTVGQTRAEILLAQSLFDASSETEAATLLRREGEGGVFAFYVNNNNTSEVYVCRRRGRASVTATGPNGRRVSGMLWREQV